MADLLVTGGAGFIGANFVRHWRRAHPADAIVVLDALTYAGNPTNLADLDGVDLVVGDIRDTALVERLLVERGIDRLIHFAAESHVDRSIAGPDAFVETNIMGTHSLLKAARAAWLDRGTGRPHRFHNVSTDEVFGSLAPEAPPATEASPFAPNSPYAASKAAADHLVRAYHRTYGLDAVTSFCSNNYGPYQFPEKLIPLFLLNALHGLPLPLYGDGRNVRDWLHVEDHCRGLEAALLHGAAGESYALGGGEEQDNIRLAQSLCAGLDALFADRPELARRFPDAPPARGRATAALLHFVADRPGHDRRYALATDKARDRLGFAPRRRLADGLAQSIAWYVEAEAWWRPLRAAA
ncbi:dTDP-glucose 4,6-dehydratase [Sphingomonas morindae]|uniref:dTDP-glucose 4,6-dehydratase n=1 Tax=Sphingomonas morindae TaxID=1541170 RepID=A0ABY4X643_9SPHN|nr:dTDP-glucose 4,6-dehydratase [Sphingomonas morindae]USI72346.1 dTDP-glucose 4,6-dehydratase [Sphingomonas morindae]